MDFGGPMVPAKIVYKYLCVFIRGRKPIVATDSNRIYSPHPRHLPEMLRALTLCPVGI